MFNDKLYEIKNLDDSMNFVFITSSYNQSNFVIKNLNSIKAQNYPKNKYRLIYVDDASTDDTSSICKEFIKNNKDLNIEYIKNIKNQGPAYSRYIAYQKTDDKEICVFLDGDDWLIDDNCLFKISWVYKNTKVDSTYGSNIDVKGGVARWDAQIYYREKNWKGTEGNIFPHLRTARSYYCKLVPEKYLKFEGEWLKFCTDCAFFQSIEELTGNNHITLSNKFMQYNNYSDTNNKETGWLASFQDNPKAKKARIMRRNYAKHIKNLKPLNKIK